MSSLKFILICLFVIFSSINAEIIPQQDLNLLQQFKENQIRLIVMRNAEAINNQHDLMICDDSPGLHLTAVGKFQAIMVAEAFQNENIDRIYVSPLYSSMQTAEYLGELFHIPYHQITVDNRLKQQYFGSYEGRTFQDYKEYFAYNDLMYQDAAPSGESGLEVFERTRDFLWDIAITNNQKTLFIIAQGFNYIQMSKCLTGEYGEFPDSSQYVIYDFSD